MLLTQHSWGWVVARNGGELVGFVNRVLNGLVHARIHDTTVAGDHRSLGIWRKVIGIARDPAARAGYEWLHVDFDGHLRDISRGA